MHVLGYSNSVQRDVLAFLNDLEQDAVSKLGARLAGVETGKAMSQKQTDRINETIEEIQALTKGVYDKTHDHLRKEFLEFAQSEAEFSNKAVNRATYSKIASKLPTPNRLKAIVEAQPLHGRILKPWLDGMGQATSDRVAQQIRLGISQGEGVDKIVRRVMGSEGFEGSRNSARTMVRTSVNAISAQTQFETMQANADIYQGWQFGATLDSRTTLVCAELDGKVFALDDRSAAPPRHPNCRSVVLPATKSWKELGKDGKDYSSKTRASMDGQIAAPQNYEAYMRGKGDDFQNEVMGKTRADLWRADKLKFSDFVRNYSEVIPLSELRKLHPEAFGGAADVAAGAVATGVARLAQKAKGPKNPAQSIDHAFRGETIDTAALDAVERDYVLETGRETMTEHLVAYDARTGAVIERKEGDRSSVEFTPSLVAALDDPKNRIILHHNHPRSSSLSLPDMMVVTKRQGAAAIYAHGHNGSVFYARRGRKVFRKKTVDTVESAVQRSLQILISRGVMSVPDANLMHHHLIWLHLHKLEQITYIAELQGESLAAWERNKAMFELILENMK